MSRRLVHVDVDNLWIYENEYKISFKQKPEYLYAEVMPRFLELFTETNIKGTFFVIGKDLEASSEAKAFCREAVKQGHEIANHSYSHPQNMHAMSWKEKESEILDTHDLIADATGVEPIGFRGPGYCVDQDVVNLLSSKKYLYDSSYLPGWGNSMMMSYLFLKNPKSILNKKFGSWGDAFRAQKISEYPSTNVKEIPLSVMPWVRLPFHTTFIYQFGESYLKMAKMLCQNSPYVIHLLHAADLLDFSKLGSYPQILPARWSLEKKRAMIKDDLILGFAGDVVSTRDLLDNA